MWKNREHKSKLTMKIFHHSLYSTFRIDAPNINALLNLLLKKNIQVKNIKKIKKNTTFISINTNDEQKLFAITKNLCYNIKRVKYFGIVYPIFYFAKNIGVIIGIAIMFILPYYTNDYIFNISYVGSGNVYSNEIEQILIEKGITKFTKFSSLSLDDLGDYILSKTDKLTFATAEKVGNTLKLNLIKDESSSSRITYSENLISTVTGIIEEIKVLRGTSRVRVGDSVNCGDILCDGFVTIKDAQIKTGVVATYRIRKEYNFIYTFEKDDCENIALSFSKEQLEDKNIVNEKIEKETINGKTEYRVALFVDVIVSSI